MQTGSLKTRLSLATLALFSLCSVALVLSVNYFQRQYALTVAEEESVILLQHNLAIHAYINKHLKPALFGFTDPIRNPDYFDPKWMSSTYAVRTIDKLYRQHVGTHYYKEAAINARSPENEADDFERDFILRLNKDRTLDRMSVLRNLGGKPYVFTIIRGETMERDCLRCHSTPARAPADLVKAYGATRSFNRSVGEVVSAISIRMPLEQAYGEANIVSMKLSGLLLCILLATFLVKNWLVNRQVLAPLGQIKAVAETISTHPDHLGDTIPQVYATEINEIAGSFNKMSLSLRHHVEHLDVEIHRRTAELKSSEAKFRQLFTNMTNCFAIHKVIRDESGAPVDYRFMEVNPAFESLTGLPASSLAGRTVREVMPATEPDWSDMYESVATSGEPVSFLNYARERDRYYDCWAFSPEHDLVAVVFSDITGQKRQEKVLEHRLETLTNPLDSSNGVTFGDLFNLEEIQRIQDVFALATGVASIITTPDGQPITRPSNFCDLCLHIIRKTEKGLANCFRSDALLGKMSPQGPTVQPCLSGGLLDGGTGIHVGGHHVANWLVGQVLDESCDMAAMMSYAREIGASEEEYSQALARVTRMSRGQFDIVCQALYQIAGQLSRMAMQNVNQAKYIAARKRAEDALAASERHFRELLENVDLMAVTLDVNGDITFCNNYLLNLTGWTMVEVLGRNWFDLFIPVAKRDQLKTVFGRIMKESESSKHYENTILIRSGKERLIVWSNTMLHDPEGRVIGVASIGNDVTEHRNMEEQLRQSQKMEAVGQLAGGVAHDFNNILQVIIGYSNLLKMDGALDDRQRERVEHVISASEKASQLTHGLLAFSRKQKLVYKDANLNDIVHNVRKFLQRIIGEDIQLNSLCYAVELHVCVDSTQIEQVLINLAANARDAMPKGGVLTIQTDLTRVEEAPFVGNGYGKAGKYAVLTVSDTGVGISRENQVHIFEPFFTTKEVGKGTGLGMAIVFGIVQQHGGFIDVYSELGKGTTFRIFLPVSETQTASVEADAPLPPRGGSETVLLAEDDPGVRKLVESILRKYGYDVVLAANGQEAIDRFRAEGDRIHLILMDMIMPVKNGKEAYEEISRIRPGVKVLYSSGYTADFIENRGVSEEGIELIMKPVQPLELLRKIREILDR